MLLTRGIVIDGMHWVIMLCYPDPFFGDAGSKHTVFSAVYVFTKQKLVLIFNSTPRICSEVSVDVFPKDIDEKPSRGIELETLRLLTC